MVFRFPSFISNKRILNWNLVFFHQKIWTTGILYTIWIFGKIFVKVFPRTVSFALGRRTGKKSDEFLLEKANLRARFFSEQEFYWSNISLLSRVSKRTICVFRKNRRAILLLFLTPTFFQSKGILPYSSGSLKDSEKFAKIVLTRKSSLYKEVLQGLKPLIALQNGWNLDWWITSGDTASKCYCLGFDEL